jgi:hypothetical protein
LLPNYYRTKYTQKGQESIKAVAVGATVEIRVLEEGPCRTGVQTLKREPAGKYQYRLVRVV